MAIRTKKKRYEANMRVTEIGFNIAIPDRRDGEICGYRSGEPLSYTKYVDSGMIGRSLKKEVEIEVRGLKLLSCWVDSTTNNCIKAHALLFHKNEQHATMLADLDEAKLAPCPNSFEICTDPAGIPTKAGLASIVRYSTRCGNVYQGNDRETYDVFYVYETKAKAVQEMINVIKRHRTLGGVNSVSWNRLPDSLMLELGFQKIEDSILDAKGRPRGIPMWKGNATNAFMTGGYGGPSVDSCRQLLDLLNRALKKAA